MTQDRGPIQVRMEHGEPDEAEELCLPVDSTWGLQNGFIHKMPGGSSVMQWISYGDPKYRVIWFAKVGGEWLLTLELMLPKLHFQK